MKTSILTLILLFSINLHADLLSKTPPKKGSASEFVISFLKKTKTMTFAEAKKFCHPNVRDFMDEETFNTMKTIKFDKEFEYEEIKEENNNIMVKLKYNFGDNQATEDETNIVKKINGKWLITFGFE